MARIRSGMWRHTRASLPLLLLTALAAVAIALPETGAAATTDTWRAKVGASGANGTATLTATGSTGTLKLALKALTASTAYPVKIARGTCAAPGSTLWAAPTQTSTAAGKITKTLAIPAAKLAAIRAGAAAGPIAVRVGTGSRLRCGPFAVVGTNATGVFSPTGSMTAARSAHTATLLRDGRVLIAGGAGGVAGGSYLATAELYDPTTGVFSATGSMAAARFYHTATLLPDGRVLVAGGAGGEDAVDREPTDIRATAELYDPATGTFSPTGSMSIARHAPTATQLRDGRVLVAGGWSSAGRAATAELYDPATGTFSPTGSMTSARAWHTATLLPDGRVLVWGGTTGTARATAELYDPATGTFSPTGSMTTEIEGHAATLLSDGRVLITGGTVTHSGTDDAAVVTTANLYDPATGTVSPTGSMASARRWHTATLLRDGRVLVAGGRSGAEAGDVQATAEIYDPSTGRFAVTGPMTTVRVVHTATLLPDGRVLIAGGSLGTLKAATAELYR